MSKGKILLLENICSVSKEILEKSGYTVELLKHSPPTEELIKLIEDAVAVGLRSKTILTEEVLSAAKKLEVIGCFCIGTNQVDLKAAQRLGIPVFNSPFSNSRSVAELIIGNLVFLGRRLGDQNMNMHKGVWIKSADGCHEVRGKTLGIVGYGHIGSQLSILAEAMGLRVQYFDIATVMSLGNSTRLDTLDELLSSSDFVSLHVPLTPQTENMITAREFGLMKKGSFFLNASRGTVVDLDALSSSLKSGHLAGAYVDVYPEEPSGNNMPFYTPLQGCPNTILSPHIGGSTTEAQFAIAQEVANKFLFYFNEGRTDGAVNFPEVNLPYGGENTHRILSIHQNKPGFMKSINEVLANYNIEGEVLRTRGDIGIFLADVDSEVSQEVKEKVAALPMEIKTKFLY